MWGSRDIGFWKFEWKSPSMGSLHTSPDRRSLENNWRIEGSWAVHHEEHWSLNIVGSTSWRTLNIEYRGSNIGKYIEDWISWVKHRRLLKIVDLRKIMFGGKSSDLSARTFFARFFTKVRKHPPNQYITNISAVKSNVSIGSLL